jgi:hypothetical protein
MSKDAVNVGIRTDEVKQEAGYFLGQLHSFVQPLAQRLDKLLDRRLVSTFVALLACIIRHRHNSMGLLLSELGGKLLGEAHAPAGTKRISNLLRSEKWSHQLLEEYLQQEARLQARQLQEQGQAVLLLWDESVVEKPESLRSEGLCAVRSSKAKRLSRIKPGFFNPPGGRPVHVPGFEWMGLLLAGLRTHPTWACFRWYTRRGDYAQDRQALRLQLLNQAITAFGLGVWHVFDRGYAGSRWLGELLDLRAAFVVRWPKRYQLLDTRGKHNAWKIARGKPAQVRRQVWDAHRQQWRMGAALALPVTHPDYPGHPLWLVVSRLGKGREPWYLLTNQPCEHQDQLWSVVLAYARRWQIEACFRFSKTELAIQSPRLWFWENRLKLMMIVALVYAFLLKLMTSLYDLPRSRLLRGWCHRTGKRCQLALTPLYRIRAALSALFSVYQVIIQNSG